MAYKRILISAAIILLAVCSLSCVKLFPQFTPIPPDTTTIPVPILPSTITFTPTPITITPYTITVSPPTTMTTIVPLSLPPLTTMTPPSYTIITTLPNITVPPSTTKTTTTQTGKEIRLADNNILVNGTWNPVILQYNPQAVNPSYAQLIDFLNQDITDTIPYTSTFVCADFANKLYNDSESNGIRSAYIVLDGIDHALNAFQTIDKGLIYIDFTGKNPSFIQAVTPPWMKTIGKDYNYKKVAYIQIGKPFGLISLDTANNYGFQYSGYEQWTQDKQTFDSDLSSYNNQMTIYNNEVDADNANGGVIGNSPEYLRLQQMSNALSQLDQQINNLATKLGAFWSPNSDIVTNIEIFWQGNY